MAFPLPIALTNLLIGNNIINSDEKNLGLFLDKIGIGELYNKENFDVDGYDFRKQKDCIKTVCPKKYDVGKYDALVEIRKSMLNKLEAKTLEATTIWRLAIGLARATALENSGMALHPVYGFPILPGSGLKGMARAYAVRGCIEEKPNEQKKKEAWEDTLRIFGVADAPWLEELAKAVNKDFSLSVPTKFTDKDCQQGSVVFHDAWPLEKPSLEVDIVCVHHDEYYKGNEFPGDWQSPSMSYFITVAPGTRFHFALSKSNRLVDNEDVDLAMNWLKNALFELGAGAKTAAGYGYFSLPGSNESDDADGARHTREHVFESFCGPVNLKWEPGSNQITFTLIQNPPRKMNAVAFSQELKTALQKMQLLKKLEDKKNLRNVIAKGVIQGKEFIWESFK